MIQLIPSSYVQFSSPTNALGLTSKTYTLTVDTIGNTGSNVSAFTSSRDLIGVTLASGTTYRIRFEADFSITNGIWEATFTNATTLHKIAISYNGGSTTNDPVIYANGVSVLVTEISTPSGTYQTPATNYFIGDSVTRNIQVEDVRHYNAIKTAAQIASIASEDLSTSQTIDETNLVFHAPLRMCKGLTYSTFAGSTLETANEFIDRMNGYVGVPSGDPIGA